MEGESKFSPDKETEKIRAAALTYKGTIYEAPNHSEAFAQLRSAYPNISWFEESEGFKEGFITSTGRFVDRAEANRVASLADQIDGLDKNRPWLSAEWIKKQESDIG